MLPEACGSFFLRLPGSLRPLGFLPTTKPDFSHRLSYIYDATPAPPLSLQRNFTGSSPEVMHMVRRVALPAAVVARQRLISQHGHWPQRSGKNTAIVVLGGGLSYFWTKDAQGDELSGKPDLITLWEKAGRRRQFVASSEELLAVDANKVDNLLGLFSPGHLPAEIFRTPEVPSLTDMVVAALKMLKAKGPGFALIVEGGLIDQAHHVNHAAKALSETVAMSDAIEAALKLIDYRETLFLVTADHSHGFTMNGYPPRGHPILGQAGVSNIDGLPYTTLMYNTGPSNSERIYGDNTGMFPPYDNTFR
ncbi:hypothetical protein HPB48_021845 [Haemaphysalis longicornis]|uniref:alkaline phosphatase n=1 Tax=Haemaphysalis longicornis TaxID=44386 RepID=A0A9J6H3M5_HAELO|nr:hypothetical protein HPB48_021845 [Haemaphysalis longicornis]